MCDKSDSDAQKLVGDELRLLYSTAVTEISGFKQQQWRIANYGLLLYAAIASVTRLPSFEVTKSEQVGLSVFALAVCVTGILLTHMFTQSIIVRRERLTFMRTSRLTEQFREAWRAGKSVEEMPDFPEERVQLKIFFQVLFMLGLVGALWLVWR